jgi:hypothetical protein
MDIHQALSDEYSKRQTLKIVEYIGDDTAKFAELVEIFLAGEYRLTQRSVWAFSYCVENNPHFVEPYLEIFVNHLTRNDAHDSVKRNIVRMLQFIEIPEDLLGKIYSHCLDIIDNPKEPIATRAFAITVAAKISKDEPYLIRELQLVINKHLKSSSAAFKSRAKKVLRLETS